MKFKYIGLDMSVKMIEASIKKYPKRKVYNDRSAKKSKESS